MAISCSCGHDDFDWHYIPADDYSPLSTTTRKRCASCRALIDIGATTLILYRHRDPRTDVEARIYGAEVPLADYHLCEPCADLYHSITAAGYCLTIGVESIQQQWRNYLSDQR